MNIIPLDQGSPAWHAWRATRRMASESPALLGLSPWAPKTPLQLFELKTGLRTIAQNPAMLHGIVNEGRAREQYEWDHDRPMPPCVLEDADGEYGASLDGRSADGKRIIEIKCVPQGTTSALWGEVFCGRVPEHYQAQVQHQLMVSGADACDFIVYASDIDSYELVEVAPDPGRQLQIRFAWDLFWPLYASHTPPEPIEGDYIERFDAAWLDLETRYLEAKSAEVKATEATEKLRGELLALAADQSERLRVTRYWARGNVDYGKIPALKGVDLDGFRKKGGYRFRIGEVNGNG